jgi:two-component system NtrC family sensor kinase
MISSSLDLDQVLVSALEGLERLLVADTLALVLSDEDAQSWVVRTARAPKGVWLEGRVVPREDAILHDALAAGVSNFHTAIDTGFWTEALDRAPLDALCVPMVKRDEVIGALVVLGQMGKLDEDAIPLLEHVAATVSVAVQNAWLFQDLEAYAEELERSQNQLIQAEKMAAVGRLAASLAHEINNPLQAIQNSLHLSMHQGLADGKKRRFLEMAQQEVARLVQIVRRMLDFYRPSSAMQRLNVNRPVEDAMAIARKRLQQSKVEVVARLTPDLGPVRGSANQLTQVFLNIIINAIEAMPAGGTLWVGTAYHAERRQVVVAFRDSGVGIPPEIREHLFEPFHTSKPTGTGLGLAISYGIIERHGGVIEVETPPDGGTTFIVRLPEIQEES